MSKKLEFLTPVPFHPDMVLRLLKELHPSLSVHKGGVTFPPSYFEGAGEQGAPDIEEVITGGGPDLLSHFEGDLITLTIITGDVIYDPITKGSVTFLLAWSGSQLRMDREELCL
tara:strand:- start:650 stop:991 length:342 start_codon:yes stop_codon:yes gene_type:complete